MISDYAIVTLVHILNKPLGSIYELSNQTKKSYNLIFDEINQINDILELNNMNLIIYDNEEYYFDFKEWGRELVLNLFQDSEISFSPEDRVKLLFLITYTSNDFLSNYHYQEILNVSKNTTLADLKLLREYIGTYDIEIKYSRNSGYQLKGSEKQIQKYLYKTISDITNSETGDWLLRYVYESIGAENRQEKIMDLINQFIKDNRAAPLHRRLVVLVNYMTMFLTRLEDNQDYHEFYIHFPFSEKILNPNLRLLSSKILALFSLKDYEFVEIQEYLEILLLSTLQLKLSDSQQKYFSGLVERIVFEMEKYAVINFEDKDEMIENLYKHLVPAYYRILLELDEEVDISAKIKDQYNDLFTLVSKALKVFGKELNKAIPENEIALFVIHFEKYLNIRQPMSGEVKAIIVCPNGISSSLILKKQLQQLFPSMIFLETNRLNDFYERDKSEYDIVFSTVYLDTDRYYYLLPTLLDEEKSSELYRIITNDFPMIENESEQINKILNIIRKNTTIHNESLLKFELNSLIQDYSLEKREGGNPLLHDLITEETFQVSSEKLDWEDAIALAAEPLLDKSYINDNYVAEMINRVKDLGPFINLGKGVAIPHARPEDGVSELGMAMLILKEPVLLLNDTQPVQVLIVIAAVDNETHLSALAHLTNILREDESIETIKKANVFNDVKHILYQGGN